MRYEGEFQLRSCNFHDGRVALTSDVVNIVGGKLEYDRDRIDVNWPELLEHGVEFGDRFRVTIERLE